MGFVVRAAGADLARRGSDDENLEGIEAREGTDDDISEELAREVEEIRELEEKNDELAIQRGEEFFVLYRLLRKNGLNAKPNWEIDRIREQFTWERGSELFGFFYTNNKWHTNDSTLDFGMAETFKTNNFLEAYDQEKGVKYEITEHNKDFPWDASKYVKEAPLERDPHLIIERARKDYKNEYEN